MGAVGVRVCGARVWCACACAHGRALRVVCARVVVVVCVGGSYAVIEIVGGSHAVIETVRLS